ncbi:follicle cell protein 3C-1 isoform X2 [Ischnura elegans]|nr:follicle cell protein 3C-1 isoform X2 [Ischnura elegans]XP_046392598.1 follicle cell protein 3C-1 isoform X2 [Ischnura elegans]XP_046392599.1 follicle cell protein 3C-1 isoform X2 [Ischnura elegans]
MVRAEVFVLISMYALLSSCSFAASAETEIENNIPMEKILGEDLPQNNTVQGEDLHPCVCAVFLSSQLDESGGTPKGEPFLQHSHEAPCLPRGPVGIKICTNKCIEMASKHLHNSKEILCAVADRDIDREKAHLFVKNCEDKWVKTNLSSGREYCCKNGLPIPCPITPMALLLKRKT